MITLDYTWSFIAGKSRGDLTEARVRSELLNCCCLGCPFTPILMSGGAVGQSVELDLPGAEFALADKCERSGGRTIPVLALSLFNGIGCCYRYYDLIGLTPQVCIAYEADAAANRVTSRRWPNVILEGDVRKLGVAQIREWRYLYPEVEEIHVWFGFPCVRLSRVRAGRKNLDDPQSGLFWEAVQIIKNIRQVFGYNFRVLHAAENVASMDVEAEAEISRALGVKPLRLDPVDLVPLHRPRFCWTDTELVAMEGITLEEKARWTAVHMEGDYPSLGQWMEPGAIWPGFDEGAILPTCMNPIKRASPPPSPAGLNRIGFDDEQRWRADDFRFPPHQYHHKLIFRVNDHWRLVNADERELLHGLGFQHTAPCWNASKIKQDPQGMRTSKRPWLGTPSRVIRLCSLRPCCVIAGHLLLLCDNFVCGWVWHLVSLVPSMLRFPWSEDWRTGVVAPCFGFYASCCTSQTG